jgi:glycosyltransferase involved in cell wall biosynthesis
VRPRRVLICDAQVPFAHGGAETLVETLRQELVARGYEVDVSTVPFNWVPRLQLVKSALAWRMLDLTEIDAQSIDLVIATRFPSYVLRHPNKVVWLVHQFRAAYELKGTVYSDFADTPEDLKIAEMIRTLDRRGLGEARRLFSISRNTARRLEDSVGLRATPLYPPPKMGERYRSDGFGDYVLGIGRLNAMKRFDLLVRALVHTRHPVRCVIAGRGPDREMLEGLAAELGVGERVRFAGFVDDEQLIELYAGALGVFFAPYDEDYGYITVEAFKSGKPVLTTADAGGVLELVEDRVNGFVCGSPSPRQLARCVDELYANRELAAALGTAGRTRVEGIGWDQVVSSLVEGK